MFEFRVQCSKLKSSILVVGIPNTFVLCHVKHDVNDKEWIELKDGGSDPEVVKHTCEPVFGRAFRLKDPAGQPSKQLLRFSVYETSSSTTFKTKEKYLIGRIECTLAQLISSNPYSRRLMFDDKSFARTGTITIFTDRLGEDRKECKFKFSATDLDDKDTISVSDPYLEVYKRMKNDLWELLHRTEVKVDTLDPQWSEFSIMKAVLANNNFTNEIKFVISDYDDDGKHDFIGESIVSVDKLIKSSEEQMKWACFNQHKKYRRGDYKDSGTLIMDYCKVDGEHNGSDIERTQF